MAETLTEQRFDVVADETLKKLVEALDDTEEETFEADLESGVLSIRFDDGTKYVINSHRAAKQIWMAAGATAWHFDFDGKRWVAGKTGEELWAMVDKWVGQKLGRDFALPR